MDKSQSRPFILFIIPFALYLGFLFFLSSQEQNSLEVPIENFDKVIHFLLYLPTPWFAFIFLRNTNIPMIKNKYFFLGIFLCVLYAALDEFHQHFIPTRHMDFFDWVADSAGILAGAFLYKLCSRRRS